MFRCINTKSILLAITVMLIFSLSMSSGICANNYKFNLATANYPWGEGGIDVQLFAQSVRMLTGSEVDITIFPNGEWGGASEEDYIKNIEIDTLDMACISISPISQSTDALNVFNLPFLFKRPVDKILFTFESESKYTPVVEKAIERVNKETNLILLMLSPIGRRDVFSSKPINSIEDLKGMKIRTMGDQIQVDTFNFMGAIATPLPYSECYTALQLHNVDAMENSPNIYLQKKFYEVAPYWLGTSHFTDCLAIIMSKKAWNSLPTAYQNILKSCAIAAGFTQSQWSIGSYEVLLGGQIEKVAKKLVYLTEEEQEKLRGNVLPKLLDKYGKGIGMDVIVALAEEDEVIKDWYDKNK